MKQTVGKWFRSAITVKLGVPRTTAIMRQHISVHTDVTLYKLSCGRIVKRWLSQIVKIVLIRLLLAFFYK